MADWLMGKGVLVDFRNIVIILTSNPGVKMSSEFDSAAMGFLADVSSSSENKGRDSKDILDVIKKIFRPEFLNRLDDMIVFKNLSQEEQREILGLLLRVEWKNAWKSMDFM
jgi:ATPases with chaperone activity, ATP-binding subunit